MRPSEVTPIPKVYAKKKAPTRLRARSRKPRPTAGSPPPEVVEAVEARANGRCEVQSRECLASATSLRDLHHRRMRSQGGLHTVENLLSACPACHTYVHAHPAESYREGWLIRSSEETP